MSAPSRHYAPRDKGRSPSEDSPKAHHAWTGSRYIDVRNPDPEDLILSEIATGLSREARYGGSCTRAFWSVAQHCLLIDQFAESDGLDDPAVRLALLLHDAPEYLLRDIIRPVKMCLPDYVKLEDVWWRAVAERFGIPYQMPDVVRHYDNLACGAEKEALIDISAGPWAGIPERPGRYVSIQLMGLTMPNAAQAWEGRVRYWVGKKAALGSSTAR